MTMTQFKPDIELSPLQEAIIKNVCQAIKEKRPATIAVGAVAGSGKSTATKYIALAANSLGVPINEIKITVFGKKNSLLLKKKLGKQWERSICTLNSLGFSLIENKLGRWSKSDKIDEYKYVKIGRELGYLSSKGKIGSLIESRAIEKGKESSFCDAKAPNLITLLRCTLSEPTVEKVSEISRHFQLEGINDYKIVAKAAEEILHTGKEWTLEKKIDYTDQIWLPCVWELYDNVSPFRVIIVDEAQDLNTAQREMTIKLCNPDTGIKVYVGDERQSIMGFSGADAKSWQAIVNLKDVVEMPLSVCYRCGKKHIELVNQLYPEIPITAYEKNHDGEIIQIKESDLDKYLTKESRNIMVIARRTSPLVSLCIKLLSKGIPAQVKGKNVGDSLVREAEAIALRPGFQWNHFPHWVEQYRISKLTQYKGLDNYEQLKETLDDKLEALLAIYEAIGVNKTLESFKIYTEDLFSDTDEESVIYLSSCHSSKGLEREDTVIVEPDKLPFSWKNILPWQEEQEENLHYVAMTRAKKRLIIVGECDWYKAPKKDTKPEKEPEAIAVSPSLLENEHWTGEVFEKDDDDDEKSPPSLAQRELEQEIRNYFKNNGLKEPKLTEAYIKIINITLGTMGRNEIDERVNRFFSPKHREAVKQFAHRLCDIQEKEIETESVELQRIEAHLEAQRQKLGMRDEDYEYDGEVQITPDEILVKSYNGKIYNYPRSAGIPDWASLFPILYYPGCEPQNQEPNPSSLLSAYYRIAPDRDSAYYGITPEDLNLSARLSPPVDESDDEEPSDEELKEAVRKAIARFGPKNVIIEAIQQATVSEIQEIMAILDDW
ncbi:AAA family ATPase [Scytonema sp. UIC 10036]|uniref:UvrD-helicase domain-containing protein n=1 Tax=Scytonema sp. UIC 10036 TaxID=2304196 RepID=UPI0012DAB6BD|nr:UvrD-helicase domain-containing protein [Scytonema sp. UIC 10036]MUH00620.1 AAA family ATPase [Scytonema sp. UIC 10036]